MLSRKITAVVLTASMLAACTDMGPKETTGTLVGAGAGAVIGGQVME